MESEYLTFAVALVWLCPELTTRCPTTSTRTQPTGTSPWVRAFSAWKWNKLMTEWVVERQLPNRPFSLRVHEGNPLPPSKPDACMPLSFLYLPRWTYSPWISQLPQMSLWPERSSRLSLQYFRDMKEASNMVLRRTSHPGNGTNRRISFVDNAYCFLGLMGEFFHAKIRWLST